MLKEENEKLKGKLKLAQKQEDVID